MSLWIKTIFLQQFFIFSQALLAQDCREVLHITSDIEEVSIFINDSLAGRGKIFNTEIEPGIYSINVIESSARWNAKSFTDTINIYDCSEIKLSFFFRDEILLNTDPQNVSVFKGDSLIGFTPMHINSDFGKLLLRKTDYLNREITAADLMSDKKIKLDFTGEVKKENFYESTLFKILAGTAVALGVATAYFKLEADKRFDEYKITGDPELLDQTNQLDLISAVTFVALQIDFGMIFYFFLSD
jgi:hypothetical protein